MIKNLSGGGYSSSNSGYGSLGGSPSSGYGSSGSHGGMEECCPLVIDPLLLASILGKVIYPKYISHAINVLSCFIEHYTWSNPQNRALKIILF